MRVKTTAPHSNEYGEKNEKAEGDEYDCPDNVGQSLVANDLVSEVEKQDSEEA